MKFLIYLAVFSLQYCTALDLNYNFANHYYDDLLISISPDVPDTDSAQLIDNIKAWVTEVCTSYFRFNMKMSDCRVANLCTQPVKDGIFQQGLHSCSLCLGSYSWSQTCSWGPWRCSDKSRAHQLHLWRLSLYSSNWRMWRTGRVHSGEMLQIQSCTYLSKII